MEVVENFQYNSIVILSYFFLSLFVLLLHYMTKGKSTNSFFSTRRSSVLNPLTYLRLFTHVLGHRDFDHFMHNFLCILLIGPMIEEKYGSLHLLIMILITSFLIGLINSIISKNIRIKGASGIVFMLIVLSSFVNTQSGKIPLTFVLICLFYVLSEIKDGLTKKDNISHMGHLVGALCGCVFGFYFHV